MDWAGTSTTGMGLGALGRGMIELLKLMRAGGRPRGTESFSFFSFLFFFFFLSDLLSAYCIHDERITCIAFLYSYIALPKSLA